MYIIEANTYFTEKHKESYLNLSVFMNSRNSQRFYIETKI